MVCCSRFIILQSVVTRYLFVQKVVNCYYLNYVYNEILSNLTDFIVIYGWSMGDCDTHLIKKIFSNKKIKTVAVSIYNENRELQAIQEEKIAIENKIKHYNKEIAVEFWEC